MTGIGIVLVAAGLSLLMTLVALQGCGVNRRNHGLFVKVMRLKARNRLFVSGENIVLFP